MAELDVASILATRGKWVLADLEGKGRCVRTVGIPIGLKHGINAWTIAAGIADGWLPEEGGQTSAADHDVHLEMVSRQPFLICQHAVLVRSASDCEYTHT